MSQATRFTLSRPIDASASRTAAIIRNKRVRVSRKAEGQPWTCGWSAKRSFP